MTQFYGLTGGIGSGKSTVVSIFSNLGVPVLDLDQVGKNIIDEEPIILEQLVQNFGSNILNVDHTLNRKKMASLVFSSTEKTKALNALLHPLIQKREQRWREQQMASFAIIEASVLIESGGYSRMDGLIVVDASLNLREQRVLNRGKQDQAMLKRIINQQCDDKTRCKLANYILNNNHDIESLTNEVIALYQTLSQTNISA